MISIIVPAFNTSRFLPDLAASLAAQTFTDWECVIVDDGSTDDTLAIAKRIALTDARFSVHAMHNRGPAAARNQGFRLSSRESEFVTFMDSDDMWLPQALESLMRGVEADPTAIGCHGLADFMDADGDALLPGAHAQFGRSRMAVRGSRLVPQPLDEPTDFRTLIAWNVLFPPGLLLASRSAYEAAGPFDESFRGAEDWDMLIRLSRHGHFRFLNEVILKYRRHEANQGAMERVPGEAWLVRAKAFFAPENTAEQRKIARAGWRGYQRLMVRERLSAARAALRERDMKAVLDVTARAGVSALRFAQGSPRPRVQSDALTW